jgi:hypothetical protein
LYFGIGGDVAAMCGAISYLYIVTKYIVFGMLHAK